MKKSNSCVQCGESVSSVDSDFCSPHCKNEQLRMMNYVSPSQTDTAFWNQYRFLQRELIQCLDFVAPRTENYQVYSDKFLSIIRGACSEIDSACKKILTSETPADKTNMADWRKFLEETYIISRVCIYIPLFQTYIRPFRNFEIDKRPDWWEAFTNLKHQRDKYFNQATLEHALNAMGALLILNVILLEQVFNKIFELRGQSPAYSDAGILSEIESLFRLWGQGIETIVCGGTHGTITLFRINKRE